MVALRQNLVTALVACTDAPFRAKAKRFASGLSADELQFIAEYLGACILESDGPSACAPAAVAERLPAADRGHKLLLLTEYLTRTGIAVRVRAERAS